MKAFFGGLVVGLALSMTATALAETSVQGGIAAARAFIDSEGVGDVFEGVEDENIKIRHRASGLTCHYYGEETTRRLLIFDGLARGDDVGCASEREHQAITLYATRYSPAVSLQGAMADADAAIRNRFTDARPTPALLSMSSEGLPEVHAQHYVITLRDEQWLTSVFLAQSGDWIIKLRFTQRALDQEALMPAQLEGNAIMMLALTDLAGQPPSPEAVAPAPNL